MLVVYLHGFASSARSSKATFLAARLRAHGIELVAPDLNAPDFSTLTVSRMIEQVTAAIDALPDGPVALIGSSLGGFVAVQVALRRPSRIDRLVLLAPALDFGPSTSSGPSRAESRDGPSTSSGPSRAGGTRMRALGDRGLDEWQRTNRLEVFHYDYGRMMPVHYELYADARRYDCAGAQLAMPVLVFQGRRDDAVDPEAVERWARARPGVELHLLDDDHQLASSLDYVWQETRRFLGIP